MDWDTTVSVLEGLAAAVRSRRAAMRIAVLGAGLIGGSIGLAARERLDDVEVAGWGAPPERLERARELGAIDVAAGSLEEALDGAEACFCCAPVGALPDQIAAALAAAPPGCVVTDVGSVKHAIVAGVDDERFVGGHPIAGAETAGVEHARADLFQGAVWYLTPTEALVGPALRAPAPPGDGARRAAGGDRRRGPRPPAGGGEPPAARAGQRAGRPGRATAARCRASGPSFRDATRVAGANSVDLDRHLPGQPRGDRRRDRRRGRAPARGGGRSCAPATPRP